MAGDRIQIAVDDDGLEATISIAPGDSLGKGAVAAALEAAGIVHGVDERELVELESRIGNEKFSLDQQPIAQGTPPSPGQDGKLELTFQPGPHPGMSRSDGSLDLLNRGLLTRVSVGDAVAYAHIAVDGAPGIQVTGKAIAGLPGKESTIALGSGVEKLDNGTIQSLKDGAVHFRPGSLLDVLDHYQHSGDVDVRSGHLETEGSISITGAVNENFEVRAGGDIDIKGAVFGGRVDGKGNVQVAGAINGGDRGYVRAGGDLRARHAQNARVECRGTLSLATDCVSTSLRAQKLEVGRRVLGGEAIVETLIVALEAGSESGAGTLLRVGEPYQSVRDQKAIETALHKTKRTIARRGASRGGVKGFRAKGGKKSRTNLALEREELKQRQERCAARAELLKVARIDIEGTVGVGVEICFGSRRLHIETNLGPTRFEYDEEARHISASRIEA
ncbi:MAG: DUF342 domain-containing protein [Myxococcales bacterium]|nr:DUF342 domain-containing protein [Myxococcales bacterium]